MQMEKPVASIYQRKVMHQSRLVSGYNANDIISLLVFKRTMMRNTDIFPSVPV